MVNAVILSAFALVSSSCIAAVIVSYDFNSDTQGWAANSVNGFAASGGYLIGTASSNDPQLLKTPANITISASQTWSTVVFRVRELDDLSGKYIGSAGAPAFSPVGMVVQFNSTALSSGFTVVSSGDDFHTITCDISSIVDKTIANFRLDPIGGALSNSGSETTGNSFEVDFIQVNAVPEPGIALLGSLGMLVLLRRRR